MFRQCSVARLAVDVRMPAALLFFKDIRMAVFASLMASEAHRVGSDFGQGISAVVSILSETLRHKKRTNPQKPKDANDENRGQPKQVPCILEGIHKSAASQLHRSADRPLCAESQTDVFVAT
jgi:hypothetical protein